MIPQSVTPAVKTVAASLPFAATDPRVAFRLTAESKAEVISFLTERPLHTFAMNGLIRDNGVESEFNRGVFYGCRNQSGLLDGIALIGHAIFIEARSEFAVREFARLAQQFQAAHAIVGDHESIERFWSWYGPAGQQAYRSCREIIFELKRAAGVNDLAPNLRLARAEDLRLIAPVHADLAFEESGVDPLAEDPEGFRSRCYRRIERERVWVLIEKGQLIFKADIISDTPEVIYVEGVFVNPAKRGRGYGARCLSQLSHLLLQRTKSITVMVNAERHDAQMFFEKLGFVSRLFYDTIFLNRKR
jgi:uncharacterized protein